MLIGLVVVLGLIVAAAWWLKRRQRDSMVTSQDGDRLNLAASLNLGMRRQLNLVEVEGSWVLIGQSERGLTALAQGTLL